MSKANVAFFGTSDRSIPILEALNKNFNLVLCVTKTDSKVGRHQQTRETEVKKWAKKHSIPYVLVDKFSEENTQKVHEQLLSSDVLIGVVADFSLIIPEKIIETPKKKLINIHFSLLPRYRGASPVQAAILNQDDVTGVSYFIMEKGMDTGDIIGKIEYKLQGTETSGELYEKLFIRAAEKLPEILNEYIIGNIRHKPQNSDEATYTYSPTHPKNTFIYKEDAKINWELDSRSIESLIRAYNPWPIAWTTLKELGNKYDLRLKDTKKQNLMVKIYSAHIESNKLEIDVLQVEGKSKMGWEDFINGYVEI